MPNPGNRGSVIINREFTWFVIARFLFIAGLRMTPFLLGWKLYEVTGSSLSIGIVGLSEVIPAVLLALYAGVTVDKSNKHRLISICMALYFLLMVGLLIVTSGWFTAELNSLGKRSAGQITQWLIYGLVFFTGAVRAFSSPAINAFLAQLVPQESLVRAVSLNSMTWLIAAVAGPGLSGLLMGFTNTTVAFTVSCIAILAALIIFQLIKPKPISWQPGKVKTWHSVKEGLNFVFHQKALLSAISLDMFAVLFGGITGILPVFAVDILHVGPEETGWLYSATYLGNFIAIALLISRPLKNKQGKTLLYTVAGFGICILIFAISKNFWLSLTVLFISGLFDGVSVIIRGTIVQLFVPDEMRGRVSAVNSIFVNSSNELGQFESGVAASIMGPVPSVIFGGCMTLFVTVVTWIKAPTLRKFEY